MIGVMFMQGKSNEKSKIITVLNFGKDTTSGKESTFLQSSWKHDYMKLAI